MPDWKKEIRVSDLFKRKPKGSADATDGSAEGADAGAPPSSPAPDATSESARQQPTDGTVSTPVPQPVAGPPAAPTGPAPTPPPPAPQPQRSEPGQTSQSHPGQSTDAPDPARSPAGPATPRAPVPGQPPVEPTQVQPTQAEPGQVEPTRPDASPAGSSAPQSAAVPTSAVPPTETPTAPTPPPAHAEVSGEPGQPASTTVSGDREKEEGAWKRELHASDLLKKMGWSSGSKGPRGKAVDQRTPRPDAPRPAAPQPDSPAQGGEDASRWKREIRAGDLFRRREQAPVVPGDAFSEQGSEPVSFWKKELSLADLLRTSAESSGTATVDAPGQESEPAPALEKEATKTKPRGLPKLDLKLGRSSLGKKRGPRGGPATTPIAVPLTRAVNLLPPDLVAQKTRKFGRAELAVAAAAVVVIAGLVVVFMSASSRVTEAQDQVVVLEQQQAELEQAALAAAAGAGLQTDPLLGEELARATALSNALGTRTVWDRILRQVTVVMPPDTWLRGLSGTSTTADVAVPVEAAAEFASTLTLTGYALSREGVAQMLSRMDTVPELANVQLLAATVTELSGEEVVEFSITATLEESVQLDPAATPIGVTP